ncbi:hypothetical protein HZB07_01560, partial [Candidatus Saganbacteria bacterium]|nr:hypothetical protein [Candidatus Saganbacteria bacterium]
ANTNTTLSASDRTLLADFVRVLTAANNAIAPDNQQVNFRGYSRTQYRGGLLAALGRSSSLNAIFQRNSTSRIDQQCGCQDLPRPTITNVTATSTTSGQLTTLTVTGTLPSEANREVRLTYSSGNTIVEIPVDRSSLNANIPAAIPVGTQLSLQIRDTRGDWHNAARNLTAENIRPTSPWTNHPLMAEHSAFTVTAASNTTDLTISRVTLAEGSQPIPGREIVFTVTGTNFPEHPWIGLSFRNRETGQQENIRLREAARGTTDSAASLTRRYAIPETALVDTEYQVLVGQDDTTNTPAAPSVTHRAFTLTSSVPNRLLQYSTFTLTTSTDIGSSSPSAWLPADVAATYRQQTPPVGLSASFGDPNFNRLVTLSGQDIRRPLPNQFALQVAANLNASPFNFDGLTLLGLSGLVQTRFFFNERARTGYLDLFAGASLSGSTIFQPEGPNANAYVGAAFGHRWSRNTFGRAYVSGSPLNRTEDTALNRTTNRRMWRFGLQLEIARGASASSLVRPRDSELLAHIYAGVGDQSSPPFGSSRPYEFLFGLRGTAGIFFGGGDLRFRQLEGSFGNRTNWTVAGAAGISLRGWIITAGASYTDNPALSGNGGNDLTCLHAGFSPNTLNNAILIRSLTCAANRENLSGRLAVTVNFDLVNLLVGPALAIQPYPWLGLPSD